MVAEFSLSLAELTICLDIFAICQNIINLLKLGWIYKK